MFIIYIKIYIDLYIYTGYIKIPKEKMKPRKFQNFRVETPLLTSIMGVK